MGNHCNSEGVRVGAHEFQRPNNRDHMNLGCVGCFPNPQNTPFTVDHAELLTHNNEMIPMGKISLVSIAFLQKDEIGFLKACAGKNVSALRHYLNKGVNVNLLDEDRTSPLHIASRSGSLQVVEELVNSGATINMADMAGWTSLHVAAFHQRPLVCHMLLKKGADPYLMSRQGETPWDMVREKNTEEIFHIHFNRVEIKKMSNLERENNNEEVNENISLFNQNKLRETNAFKTKRVKEAKKVESQKEIVPSYNKLSFADKMSFLDEDGLRNIANSNMNIDINIPDYRCIPGSFVEKPNDYEAKQPKKHKYYLYFKKIKEDHLNNLADNKTLLQTLYSEPTSIEEVEDEREYTATHELGFMGLQKKLSSKIMETAQEEFYSGNSENGVKKTELPYYRSESLSPSKRNIKPVLSTDIMKTSNQLFPFQHTLSLNQRSGPGSMTKLSSSGLEKSSASFMPLINPTISIYKMIGKDVRDMMFIRGEEEISPYIFETENYNDMMSYKVETKFSELIYRIGIELFNFKSSMGLSFLMLFKFVKPDPKEVAFFLAREENQMSVQKNASEVTDLLTNLQIKESFEILQNYSKFFHFEKTNFTDALRSYLVHFAIENDPEKIDWLLRGFARRYFKQSKKSVKFVSSPALKQTFQTVDSLRMLAFTTVMLDVELNHSDLIESFESLNQIKRELHANLAGVNDGENFSQSLINNIFEEVRKERLIRHVGMDNADNEHSLSLKSVRLAVKVYKNSQKKKNVKKSYTYYFAGPVCFLTKNAENNSVPKGLFMLNNCFVDVVNSQTIAVSPNKAKNLENIPYAKFRNNGTIFLNSKKEVTINPERETDVPKIKNHIQLIQ